MKIRKFLIACMTVLAMGMGAFGFASCNNKDIDDILNENANGLLYTKHAEEDYYIVVGFDPRENTEENLITEVVVPNTYRGLPVKEVKSKAFKECDTITSVIISDSVTTIGEQAFYECEGLLHVTIGSAVATIEDEAFYLCKNLVDVYNKSALLVEEERYGDYGSVGHCALNVYEEESEKGVFTYENGFHFYAANGENYLISYDGGAEEIVVPSTVTIVHDDALLSQNSAKKIIIPDSVKSLGWIGFCKNLTEVVLGSSVATLGGVPFSNCPALTQITVSENNPHFSSIAGNLYSKDGKTMVRYLSKANETSFVVPEQVETLDTWVFKDCTYLQSIVLPSHVKRIGDYTFSGCTALKDMIIPAEVEKIGGHAFEKCENLTSVEFKVVENWFYWDFSAYTVISVELLSNKQTAATCLNQPNGLMMVRAVGTDLIFYL